MRRRVSDLLRRSPQDLFEYVVERTHAAWSRLVVPGPRPQSLSDAARAARDVLLHEILEGIERREPVATLLRGFDARRFDERVVEYAMAAELVLRYAQGDDLLDVGCVMNSPLVAPLLVRSCRNVWLANVAQEVPLLENPVFYHLESIDRIFPRGPRFHLITCLSTIEHIGFDNRHYGVRIPARFTAPTAEPLVDSMVKLTSLLAKGGHLLVSVPFGRPELVLHPRTGRASMQVFGADALASAAAVIRDPEVEVATEVWQATPEGWRPVDPAHCTRRYADGTPAASAVALLRATRRPD